MPYILNKTSGAVVATVQDAALDTTTDLTFLGRNFAGYGETQNENFLKLLENFANTTAPLKPIEGETWYSTVDKRLHVYDGQSWKSIANLEINSASPISTKTPLTGDLWFNKTQQQLYAFNGSDYVLIGPPSGADTKAQWRGSYEYSVLGGLDAPKYNIKAVIGVNDEVVAITSAEAYDLIEGSDSYPTYPTVTKMHKGINLLGADPNTGSSEAYNNYFWGSAAHSLRSNTSTFTAGLTYTTNTASTTVYCVPFLNTTTNNGSSLVYIDAGVSYNPYTKTLATSIFSGIATSARYADLAERYEADAVYDEGTVLVIGGEKEVTVTTTFADTRVAGIVSKNPAYMMNSEAGTDETHPYIALKGRVPCKVQGYIKRGDLIVTSSTPGYGIAASNVFGGAIIGKALESQSEGFGVIEVLVV